MEKPCSIVTHALNGSLTDEVLPSHEMCTPGNVGKKSPARKLQKDTLLLTKEASGFLGEFGMSLLDHVKS